MESRRERGERIALRCLIAVLMMPVLYLLSAAIVFDFNSAACDANGCEFDEQRRLAFHGPEPRVILCRPTRYSFPTGAWWDGSEWAFKVYRPVCLLWLQLKGYGCAS